MTRTKWLDRFGTDYGTVATLDLTPTSLVCSPCGHNLAACTCESVIVALAARGDVGPDVMADLCDRAREAVISPERAVDLYREPIWAEV